MCTDYALGALHSTSKSYQYTVLPNSPGQGVLGEPYLSNEEERHRVTRPQTPSTPDDQQPFVHQGSLGNPLGNSRLL